MTDVSEIQSEINNGLIGLPKIGLTNNQAK